MYVHAEICGDNESTQKLHKGGQQGGALVITQVAHEQTISKSKQTPPEQLLHALLDPH